VSTELQRKPQICELWRSACFQNERETLDMEHCGLAGNQKLLEPRYGSTLRFRNDQNRLTMCYEDCAVVSSSRMHVQKDAWSGAVRGSVKRLDYMCYGANCGSYLDQNCAWTAQWTPAAVCFPEHVCFFQSSVQILAWSGLRESFEQKLPALRPMNSWAGSFSSRFSFLLLNRNRQTSWLDCGS
jgi:hypothetical protein